MIETKIPILRCEAVTKHFGGIVAVNQVNLDIYNGEVIGLVGDNGAGKSTLVHMISGLFHPDEGQIFMNGNPALFSSPEDARDVGIETIYQDLALCNNLNAADNIFLGREKLKRKFGLFNVLDRETMQAEAKKILKELEIALPEIKRPIKELSGGQRQAVAISRSVYWNAKLMIMDEPTAALGVPEQRKVYELVQTLKERNVPVLVISHNMKDVFAVADRIIVMRRGCKVGDLLAKETNEEEVVSLMVGVDSEK